MKSPSIEYDGKYFRGLYLYFAICIMSALCASNSMAAGGYLSFLPPKDVPDTFSELSFYFTMIHTPGPKAEAYYAQNFNFKTTSGTMGGYMGLQSTDIIGGESYALITVWPPAGEISSMSPGPNANCTQNSHTAEGSIATCVVTKANALAQGIKNGDKFRIYIKNKTDQTYEFGIENHSQNATYVLGEMTYTNVVGINSSGPSHFLEYFGANGGHCGLIPYTAYKEYGPVGYSAGRLYNYTVAPNPDAPFGPCSSNVTYASDYSSATVEFAMQQSLYTPADLGCDNGQPCQLDTIAASLYNFATFDGNWSYTLELPKELPISTRISVASHAAYSSEITCEGGGIALKFFFGPMYLSKSIVFSTDDKYTFVNQGNADNAQWAPSGPSFMQTSPNKDGPHIPGAPRMVLYSTADGDWSRDIYLPDTPDDYQLVVIHSNATWSSDLRYSSGGPIIGTLNTGQTLVYQFVGSEWNKVDWR